MKLGSTLFCLLITLQLLSQLSYLDSSFGNDGTALIEISENNDEAKAIDVQDDGKIIVFGNGTSFEKPFVFRLEPNGSVDLDFRPDDFYLRDVPEFKELAEQIIIQNDGKIILGSQGFSPNCLRTYILRRLNTDGSPDLSFGDNGIVYEDIHINGLINVVQLGNGDLVCAGSYYNTNSSSGAHNELVLSKFDNTGSLDLSFGELGHATITHIPGGEFNVSQFSIDAQGRYLVIGSTSLAFGQEYALFRILPNGTLDISFSDDGVVELNQGLGIEFYRSILSNNSGDITIIADVRNDNNRNDLTFIKINNEGDFDLSYGDGGVVKFMPFDRPFSENAIEDVDGNIYVIGQYLESGPAQLNGYIVKVGNNGELVEDFGNDGIITLDYDTANDRLMKSVIYNGRLITCGDIGEETLNSKVIVNALDLIGFTNTTSIVKDDFEVEIYPNPTSDIVNLNMNIRDDFNCKIIDVNGMVVSQSKNQNIIDFSSFKKGIHFIEITNNKTKSTITKKIFVE